MNFDTLQTQLATNPRLRLGIWLISLILLGYGLNFVFQRSVTTQATYQQNAQQTQQLQELAQQTQWEEQAIATRTIRVELEEQFWQAENQGLAQAAFQTWFEQQIRPLNLPLLRLQFEPMSSVSGAINNLWEVSVTVDSGFDAQALQTLLERLQTHPQHLVVREIDINRFNRQGRLKLVVVAYFRLTG